MKCSFAKTVWTTLILSGLLITPAAAQVQVETIPLDVPLTAWGGMALGPDGNLYIADFDHNSHVLPNVPVFPTADSAVVRVNLALDQDGQLTGTVETLITGLELPTDVTFNADGNLVIGSLNWVYIYDVNGEQVRRIPTGGVMGLNRGPDDRIYLCACDTGLGVKVINAANLAGAFVSGSMSPCPSDVAFDDDGNVFVVGNWTHIYKYAPDGSNEERLDTGAGGLPGSTDSILPKAVFANGFLYITKGHQIFQVSTTGEVTVLAGRDEPGTADGSAWEARFYHPTGIAASTTGDTLYVVSGADPRAPDGSRLARTNIRMITGVQSAQTSGVAGESAELPEGFALSQNYPNPFNPGTSIHFSLPEAMPVRLVVYDVFGREVTVLFDGYKPSGEHTVTFEAEDLPSGTYLYRLQSGTFSQTLSMLLLK